MAPFGYELLNARDATQRCCIITRDHSLGDAVSVIATRASPCIAIVPRPTLLFVIGSYSSDLGPSSSGGLESVGHYIALTASKNMAPGSSLSKGSPVPSRTVVAKDALATNFWTEFEFIIAFHADRHDSPSPHQPDNSVSRTSGALTSRFAGTHIHVGLKIDDMRQLKSNFGVLQHIGYTTIAYEDLLKQLHPYYRSGQIYVPGPL